MDPETLNMQVRKFLKQVGVTSQREIETAVREAAERGELQPGTRLPVTMTLEIPALGLSHRVEGEIDS